MKNIQSGTFQQCLADFFQRFGKTEALWKFAGVSSDTETQWRLHGIIPTGRIYIRVLFFLELIGYDLLELKKIPECVVNVSRCVAFNVTSLEEIDKKLLCGEKGLFRYLYGERKPLYGRAEILSVLASEHQTNLLKVIGEKKLEFKSLMIKSDRISPDENNSTLDQTVTQLIEAFAASCDNIRNIGAKLLDGNPEWRKALRRHMNKPESPELHLTWDVIHKLMKERQGN
jgi:hypothetical protein